MQQYPQRTRHYWRQKLNSTLVKVNQIINLKNIILKEKRITMRLGF